MSRCHHQVQARREEFLMFSLFYGSMSAGIASPPPPAPCVIHRTITRTPFLHFYAHIFIHGRKKTTTAALPGLSDWLTDTHRSTYEALMDKSGWWKESTRSPEEEEEEEGEQREPAVETSAPRFWKRALLWILFFLFLLKNAPSNSGREK